MRRYKKVKSESKIKKVILNYISDNIKYYALLFSIFVIGVIIGVLFINSTSTNTKEEITSYITSSISFFKENKIDNFQVFRISVRNNLVLGTVLWFLGTTIIGTLFLILFIGFKGFCLGYTLSSIIAIFGILKGLLFILVFLFLQNIIFIPTVITICVSGFKFSNSIIKEYKRTNIKEEIAKHSIFCMALNMFLIISSFVEVYISKNLLNFFIKSF